MKLRQNSKGYEKRNVFTIWMLGVMILGLSAISLPASATTYDEVLSWDTIKGSLPGGNVQAAVVDGDTAYFALTGSPSIVKVSNISIAQNQSVLVSSSVLTQSPYGLTSFAPWYGVSIYNGYLQFAISPKANYWRVNTETGAITQYSSLTKASSAYTTNSATGDFVTWNPSSSSVVRIDTAGKLSTLFTTTELSAAGITTSDISGGITYDDEGNLYFASTSNGLYKYATDGTISQVLSISELTKKLTNGSSFGAFKDIYYGEDGYIYLQSNGSKDVLRFLADDPATLETYLSKSDLQSGVAGATNGTNIGQFTWYDGKLAWTVQGASGSGLYVVPEPATVALLSLGLLGFIRRRK